MACREPQRGDDRIAKRLLQLCLPEVEVCLHDDGSESMMYDLDLRWLDGHVEAMEVTIAINDDLLRVDLRLIRHGSVVPARESTRNWTLGLASGTTEVRAVKGKVDHLLSLVERAGVTRFIAHDENESVAAIRVLHRLGVWHGFSFNARSEPPKITLVGPAPARHFTQPESLDSINKVVEDHARRNEKKLARSGCKERHLFVLFDFTSPEGWNAFVEQGEPPEMPLRLPDAVTTVWAAWPMGRNGPFYGLSPIVWRVRRGGRWEVLL
jgi:hypothetical protein